MLLSLLLFESEFLHIVAISFTALVINELIMVALEITTWHTYMVLSELGTALVYFGSMAILPEYFGKDHGGATLTLQTCALCCRRLSHTKSLSSWRFPVSRCTSLKRSIAGSILQHTLRCLSYRTDIEKSRRASEHVQRISPMDHLQNGSPFLTVRK